MAEANPYAAPISELVLESSERGDTPAIFSFSNRVGRLRYLARVSLFTLASYVVLALLMLLTGIGTDAGATGVVLGYGAFFIVSLVLAFMFAVQRLHDLNRSGWMSLLVLIPIVNVAIGLYLLLAPGTEGRNNYGLRPPPNTLGVKLGALCFLLIFVLAMVAAIAIPAYQDYAISAQQEMQLDPE